MQAEPARLAVPPAGIFAALEPHLRPRLEVTRHLHNHRAGHVYCVEGDSADTVTLILEGAVKLTRAGERGDPQVLRLLGPGGTFGLRPVLAGDTYAVSAIALSDCRTCTYPARAVVELLRASPPFAAEVMAHLARELRYSEDMLMVLTRRPVKRRIADVLLLLHGEPVPGEDWAPFIGIRLKRKEMAQMVGTTPETLSRTLAEFAQQGLISLDRRRIALRDVQGLEQVEREPRP